MICILLVSELPCPTLSVEPPQEANEVRLAARGEAEGSGEVVQPGERNDMLIGNECEKHDCALVSGFPISSVCVVLVSHAQR